jgi:hypothetical protein
MNLYTPSLHDELVSDDPSDDDRAAERAAEQAVNDRLSRYPPDVAARIVKDPAWRDLLAVNRWAGRVARRSGSPRG